MVVFALAEDGSPYTGTGDTDYEIECTSNSPVDTFMVRSRTPSGTGVWTSFRPYPSGWQLSTAAAQFDLGFGVHVTFLDDYPGAHTVTDKWNFTISIENSAATILGKPYGLHSVVLDVETGDIVVSLQNSYLKFNSAQLDMGGDSIDGYLYGRASPATHTTGAGPAANTVDIYPNSRNEPYYAGSFNAQKTWFEVKMKTPTTVVWRTSFEGPPSVTDLWSDDPLGRDQPALAIHDGSGAPIDVPLGGRLTGSTPAVEGVDPWGVFPLMFTSSAPYVTNDVYSFTVTPVNHNNVRAAVKSLTGDAHETGMQLDAVRLTTGGEGGRPCMRFRLFDSMTGLALPVNKAWNMTREGAVHLDLVSDVSATGITTRNQDSKRTV
tara:strand:+ start:3577 stop:4710 length:1134 start_codon:yes stop_codon:yes gene_type:complete